MLINCPVMKRWFSNTFSSICTQFTSSHFIVWLLKKFAVALLTCIFALGGSTIGAISGAITGHTTETGFSRGFVVGAVAGAITAVQLMDLIANGEPFSKVALISSLINGKIYMEWVSPAMLKAYQWQVSAMEPNLREISDIFDVNTIAELSQNTIKALPIYKFRGAEINASCSQTGCSICLEDLKDGECVRLLANCRHLFHIDCIDKWLSRQGSCPICRKRV